MRPAVFLDRDGVINENRPDYVKSWEEFRFLPKALEALKQLSTVSRPVVIVTNQSAVGRGIITLERLTHIHNQMERAVTAAGGRIDALYVCPHPPNAGCNCRKPAPGLLLRAADDLNIDLTASVFVGDSLSDVTAAHTAGVHPILVRSGKNRVCLGKPEAQALIDGCPVVNDLTAAVASIL